MSYGRVVILVWALVGSVCFAADNPDAYTIRIDRPSKKGDKAPLEIVYAHLTTKTTTWDGHEPTSTEESLGAHLICDVEVMEVDHRGAVLAEKFTIRKCTVLKSDKETDLLVPGTELLLRYKDNVTEYLVNSAPADPGVKDVLCSFIWLDPSDESTNVDAIYGSKTQRKIGESWPVNAERAIADLKAEGREVDPHDFSGDVTAKSLESCNGSPCVKIDVQTSVKHIKRSETDTDPQAEMKFKDAWTRARYSWLAPVDLSKDLPAIDTEETSQYTWTGSRRGLGYEVVQLDQTEMHCRIPGD